MRVERVASRTLLVADGAVLLIQGRDPARPEAGVWWLTPGGGIDDGETAAGAAAREVFEETGLRVTEEQLGAVIATRVAEFEFDGVHYRQSESFYAVAVERFALSSDGWEPIEQRALLDHRWWTVAELRGTPDTVYPAELPELLAAVLAGPVAPPWHLADARA